MSPHGLLEGEWVGSFRLTPNAPRHFRVEFTPAGDKMSIRALLSASDPLIAEGTVTTDGHQLQVDLHGAEPLLALRGELRGDAISGAIEYTTGEGTFQLLRMAAVNVRRLDDYAGAYELAPGSTVLIRKGVGLSRKPPYAVERSWLYYVAETGETRILFPSSQVSFFAGPALLIPDPVSLTVEFVRDAEGAVAGVKWCEAGAPERYAPRTQRYGEHDVRFRNGDLTLAGRLLLPRGPGPHPAIVLIPGGPGPSDRDEGYLVVAHLFALHGIAALTTDKRGCGASGGDWREAPFDDLASDAVAAVGYLCSRQEIDPDRVGLFGISEGGWIAPLAAGRSPAIRFLVLVAASGLTHAEIDLRHDVPRLRAAGLSAVDVDALIAFDERVVAFARSREGWEELAPLLEEAHEKPWSRHSIAWTHTGSFPPTTSTHWFWQMYGAGADYDPGPTLRDLEIPLLAIWGEFDLQTSPAPNIARLEKFLAEGAHPDYTLRVIPRGEHTLWRVEGDDPEEFQHVVTYVPEYFELLTRWLEARTSRAP